MKLFSIVCLTIAASTKLGAQVSYRDSAGRPIGAGQDHNFPVPPNAILHWADTFTVARGPDGVCLWGTAPWRNGKPGTVFYLAEVRNATCFGVIHNITPAPPRVLLNFADTFTVARLQNGNCDWSKSPVLPPKPGTVSRTVQGSEQTCSGVVWNVRLDPTFMKFDTTRAVSKSDTVSVPGTPPAPLPRKPRTWNWFDRL